MDDKREEKSSRVAVLQSDPAVYATRSPVSHIYVQMVPNVRDVFATCRKLIRNESRMKREGERAPAYAPRGSAQILFPHRGFQLVWPLLGVCGIQ